MATALWMIGPRQIELRPESVDRPARGEVVVEAIASAISHGTEMLVYRGQAPPSVELDLPSLAGRFAYPMKYGYACVGRVTAVGRDRPSVQSGDLVFAFHPHQTRFRIADDLIVRLPSDTDPVQATLLANLETAVNVMLDTPIQLGDAVVVLGAGTVGLLILALAHRRGAGQVVAVDPIASRRARAARLGASVALEPTADLGQVVRRLTDERGADVVIEASGNPAALPLAIECAGLQGTVVVSSWYGTKPVVLDLGSRFHRLRLRIVSSQVSTIDPSLQARWDRRRRLDEAVRLLAELPIEQLISHRIPFNRASEAFALIDRQPEQVSQVVLLYE